MSSDTSKGTSQAEVTSSSKKIKPVSFAIVDLHWSEGIRQQAGRQAVENSVKCIFLKIL